VTVALVGSYAVWAAVLACTVALIVLAGRLAWLSVLHSCEFPTALTVEVFLGASAGSAVLLVVGYVGAGWVEVAVGAVMLVGLPVLLGSREWRRARRDRESYRVSAERYAASRVTDADAAAAVGFGGGR